MQGTPLPSSLPSTAPSEAPIPSPSASQSWNQLPSKQLPSVWSAIPSASTPSSSLPSLPSSPLHAPRSPVGHLNDQAPLQSSHPGPLEGPSSLSAPASPPFRSSEGAELDRLDLSSEDRESEAEYLDLPAAQGNSEGWGPEDKGGPSPQREGSLSPLGQTGVSGEEGGLEGGSGRGPGSVSSGSGGLGGLSGLESDEGESDLAGSLGGPGDFDEDAAIIDLGTASEAAAGPETGELSLSWVCWCLGCMEWRLRGINVRLANMALYVWRNRCFICAICLTKQLRCFDRPKLSCLI